MKRRGMSLALCAAMAMGTIGVVPAMADDVTTITYWVNDRHDSEYMTEMVEKYNKENTDNILTLSDALSISILETPALYNFFFRKVLML